MLCWCHVLSFQIFFFHFTSKRLKPLMWSLPVWSSSSSSVLNTEVNCVGGQNYFFPEFCLTGQVDRVQPALHSLQRRGRWGRGERRWGSGGGGGGGRRVGTFRWQWVPAVYNSEGGGKFVDADLYNIWAFSSCIWAPWLSVVLNPLTVQVSEWVSWVLVS